MPRIMGVHPLLPPTLGTDEIQYPVLIKRCLEWEYAIYIFYGRGDCVQLLA
jgi:hypothetical protein